MNHILWIVVLALTFQACTLRSNRATRAERDVAQNRAALQEESRALTTGARDAIAFAPTNPPGNLAAKFLERDQQIEGMPVDRIDVPGVLAGKKQATSATNTRLSMQTDLLRQRAELEVQLEDANQRLMEMGKLYETKNQKSAVRRVWRWLIATFGVGGVIALMFFVPAVIPLFARLVGWVVSMFPKLAGFFGVVLTSSFDSVTKGVQLGKKRLDASRDAKTALEPTAVLGEELYSATDKPTKDLVDARKEVLAADGEIPPIAKVIGPPTPKLEATKVVPTTKIK